VIPEIIASFAFGPIIRIVFGPDNPNSPLFVVMAGGVFMLLAAFSVLLVRDVGDLNIAEAEVIKADASELFTLPESAQPVPSTGLVDDSD
jgi:hypothetical protein